MFLDQFTDFMILVLIAAAVISGIIGEPADTIAIIVIVVLNAALGFSQEYRAEKAMAALKKMAASLAVVVRDSERTGPSPRPSWSPATSSLLEAGNIVPADMRIIEAAQPQDRRGRADRRIRSRGEDIRMRFTRSRCPSGDRKNMLYKGTFVTYGRGMGVVTATGMDTELGRIAAMLQQEEEGKTPLQKRLADFGKKLAYRRARDLRHHLRRRTAAGRGRRSRSSSLP